MAKDKNRARRKLARLLPGFGLTPQMVLSASCNWPNTPLAPKSATAIPTTVATALAVGLPALAAIVPPPPWRCCDQGRIELVKDFSAGYFAVTVDESKNS